MARFTEPCFMIAPGALKGWISVKPVGRISRGQGREKKIRLTGKAPMKPHPTRSRADSKEHGRRSLQELLEKKEDSFKAAIYILSAMLERKRILQLHEKLKKEGRKWFAYEFGKSGEVFTVEDPELANSMPSSNR